MPKWVSVLLQAAAIAAGAYAVAKGKPEVAVALQAFNAALPGLMQHGSPAPQQQPIVNVTTTTASSASPEEPSK